MNGDRKKNILLVDDEFLIAENVKISLEQYGYSVIIVQSGEQAIDLFRKNISIDVILMDIDLGDGIDGADSAIEILKQRTIPILFLSSHTEPRIVEKTEKITSYGYVLKNSGITVLDAAIKMAFKLFDAHKMLKEELSERKRAEEKISIISRHYQALIEKAPDGIVLLNADGSLKYLSPSAKKIFGYNASDEITGYPSRFIHPDDLPGFLSNFAKLFEDPTSIVMLQYRSVDKNGTWKWVESTFSNLLSDPSVESIVVNFRDIHESKCAQKALQESEARYRSGLHP